MTGRAIQELNNQLRLLHGDDEDIRKMLAGKLAFAVRQTIKGIIDGADPSEEFVKGLINMEKLAYNYPQIQTTEKSRNQYAVAVFRACKIIHWQ